jgi:hypothetical protein
MNNKVFILASTALLAACGTSNETTKNSDGQRSSGLAPSVPENAGQTKTNPDSNQPQAKAGSANSSPTTSNGQSGAGTPSDPVGGQTDALADVQCFGINSCSPYAMCAVTAADVEATKSVFGNKFAASEVHACAGLGKCAAAQGQLNWVQVSQQECGQQGGFLIVSDNDGKKVVKKI